ncbi:MAG: GIY-YIG nuclease family protein [Bacteroidia bacterium]
MSIAHIYTFYQNKNRTVLYVGVTNDLEKRMEQNKNRTGSVFTRKYNAHELVYYEIHNDIKQAIDREKQLKEWKRDWKIDLIKTMNSEMLDLDLAFDWEYNL